MTAMCLELYLFSILLWGVCDWKLKGDVLLAICLRCSTLKNFTNASNAH